MMLVYFNMGIEQDNNNPDEMLLTLKLKSFISVGGYGLSIERIKRQCVFPVARFYTLYE